jgi:threonylcarbamoyladenosine tRNA methylthiotransferase MtaB
MNLTTDIIVGFPGETEDEWEQTLRFVEGVGFGQIHVFPYSPRPGTKAATLPRQVDEETKRRRSRELQDLAARLRREALEAAVGRRFEVLVEGEGTDAGGGERAWEGYTPSFLRCAFEAPATQDLCNRVVEVETTA